MIANRLNKTGKFTHTKDWKTIQREWNENADPIDDFATHHIIESDDHRSKRETYQFYKKYCFEKSEIPLGMGQFGKQFSEYFEEDRIRHGNHVDRVWLNIDFKIPTQTKLRDNDDL